jgi:hypothetical protein
MISATSLATINLSEFAARAAIHLGAGNAFFGLVADHGVQPDELADEFRYIADAPIRTINAATAADVMEELLASDDDSWVILHGFAPKKPQFWARIDQRRNGLQKIPGLIFLLSPTDLRDLQVYAPNLSSWLGGRVWRLADETSNLSTAEVERRLATLRAAFGKTDDEVVAAARNNQLPPEPEYAEWLILLGQGGLLA